MAGKRTSFLLTTDDQAIVLDAGTGLGRLTEPKIRRHVERFESLNIILSHYHLDHIVGLSYLPGIWTNRQVTIYAPSVPFVESTPEAALNRLLAPPCFQRLQDFPLAVDVIPMTAPKFHIGDIQVQIRAQRHPGGSVGIRIDDSVVFMTDTIAETGPLSFISGSRLLIHEAWFIEPVDIELAEKYGHSELSKVRELALASEVGRLMPMHFDPKLEQPIRETTLKPAKGLSTIIPIEGECYEV